MPIRFRCQDCRSRVKVPEGSQGKQVKCPRCGRIQSVPKHHAHQSAASQQSESVTVHTCVGSIARAPKRKETLAMTGTCAPDTGFAFDHKTDSENGSGDTSRGGSVGGGRLNIQDYMQDDDTAQQKPHHSHGRMTKQQKRAARKERRRLARQAEQEREAMAAREEAEQDDAMIAESRKQVQDLFATHANKDYTEQAESVDASVEVQTAAAPSAPPESITFQQSYDQPEAATEQAESAPAPQPIQTKTAPDILSEASEAWSFDFSKDAYPFLRIIPWVLRITALMLIGPAFKVMLVADASGFSGVVSLLILFAGLSLVVVTWTVGEIAHAVRDIAIRKAATG